MAARDDPQALRQRSRIGWGLAALCVLFLLETWNAHRVTPSPHSSLVWTVLGLCAASSVVTEGAERLRFERIGD